MINKTDAIYLFFDNMLKIHESQRAGKPQNLLNRIGFTYKKTKEAPCECDALKQESFAAELSALFGELYSKVINLQKCD